MPNTRLITILVIIVCAQHSAHAENFTQLALDAFIQNYWNEALFRDEGTGLQFHDSWPVYVTYSEQLSIHQAQSLSRIGLQSGITKPPDISTADAERITAERLEHFRQQIEGYRPDPVTLANSHFQLVPPNTRPSSIYRKGYLLRISAPLSVNYEIPGLPTPSSIVYIWVKSGDGKSWGKRIEFIFNDHFEIVEHGVHIVMDDWD